MGRLWGLCFHWGAGVLGTLAACATLFQATRDAAQVQLLWTVGGILGAVGFLNLGANFVIAPVIRRFKEKDAAIAALQQETAEQETEIRTLQDRNAQHEREIVELRLNNESLEREVGSHCELAEAQAQELASLQSQHEELTVDFATQKVFVTNFLAALPLLFQKTLHVRKTVSEQNLAKYSQEVSSKNGQKIGDAKSYVIGTVEDQFVTGGVRLLLADLREAIRELTSERVVCSMKLATEKGLVSIYETDPVLERRNEEERYLANDDLTQPQSVVGRVLRSPAAHCFDSIEDIDFFGKDAAAYLESAWPTAKTWLESLILAPVTVESDGIERAIAVLQVDSPTKGCFKSPQDLDTARMGQVAEEDHLGAITEMVKCTADAVGVIVSIASYIDQQTTKYQQLSDRYGAVVADYTGAMEEVRDELEEALSRLDRVDTRQKKSDLVDLFKEIRIQLTSCQALVRDASLEQANGT